MPGFFVGNMGDVNLENEFDERCFKESFDFEGFFCARNTLNKFMADKAFLDGDEYVVIVEGVLLNKDDLLREWRVSSVARLVELLYQEKGDTFFECFRGPFSGALYDKKEKKWVVYTSHYGDNAVFYYVDEQGRMAFGSQVNYILDMLCSVGVALSLDEHAIYAMLSYGFMVDGSTYANEVRRLPPGCYAVIFDGRCEVLSYYRPKEHVLDLDHWTDDQIIDELDKRFRNAVKQEFAKDEEYGYRHLCDLSGGLDSRMTTWVAHELGYTNCVNLTYCQAGYLDQTISEQIAADLGNEFIFKSLDDTAFLFDPERIIRLNYGLGLYAGITGGESLLRSLNMEEFGLEHTGQMGDVVIGSFLASKEEEQLIEHAGAYSSRLLCHIAPPQAAAYRDREQFLFETRGFLGALSTHLIRRNYTEVASPFLDVDVVDFCLSIPLEKRIGHRIYRHWILAKYSNAAKYVWEKEGLPLSANGLCRLLHKGKIFARLAWNRATGRGGGRYRYASMNPFEYWYASNEKVRGYLNGAIRGDADAPVGLPNIQHILPGFLEDASVIEKTQAITVDRALVYYWNRCHE